MRRLVALTAFALATVACGQAGNANQEAEAPEPTSNTTDSTASTTSLPQTTTTSSLPEANELEPTEAEPVEELELDPELPSVEVVMTEMAFEPSTFAVSAGDTVQFVLRNNGMVEHEFRLTTNHAAEEHIASGHEDHGDEEEGSGHAHDEMAVTVQPGDVTVFTVTFEEEGVFDTVACLLPGHFEAGMHAPLTYEP